MPPPQDIYRKLPSVEALLQDSSLEGFAAGVPRRIVVDCVRTAVDRMRGRLAHQGCGGVDAGEIHQLILAEARQDIRTVTARHYRRAINATGIVLHTALGRAALPARAVRQIADELAGYSLLQVDVGSGQRDQRDARIEWLLQRLTGAEAATVVNNNAAATYVVLNAVAAGREVIVSRGQLVEIGGSFRLPDVMAASGAKLVEVGTTNKTHARDYQRAITENTAAILRVHPSNYKISGFTSEVPLAELVEIAHAKGLVLIDDVGAGPLVDLSPLGVDGGPTLPGSIRAGADLVTASTDKLIGASQGGVILGCAALIEGIRRNPLARILRVGKLTLAALEATLGLFLDEAQALREVPTLRMLGRKLGEIDEQAQRIAEALGGLCKAAKISLVDGVSQMGGGSLPGQDLPTRLVAVQPADTSAQELGAKLRRGNPPVFTRISDERLLIDPRTLLPGDEEQLITAVAGLMVSG
jgi:L-seryl-tRNA(Ser) seleniumtransferase